MTNWLLHLKLLLDSAEIAFKQCGQLERVTRPQSALLALAETHTHLAWLSPLAYSQGLIEYYMKG